MKILVNGFGISDSGGVNVLEKLFMECIDANKNDKFIIMLTHGSHVAALVEKYKSYEIFTFKILKFKNYIHRFYYENRSFKVLIDQYKIDLVYNFSGSMQFFLDCRQIVKIHNLLWYSKKLDNSYKKNARFISWIKEVYLKRLVFRFMLNKSKFIEIQSIHVQKYIADFVNIKDKYIFIKSDIDVSDGVFKAPKEYDFSKKIKFLFIVGPHFQYMHKNLLDFTNVMVTLLNSGVDFEIDITLDKNQLVKSGLWNELLNPYTNFHGYIGDIEKFKALFCDNTILISTSIIETIGLHVIEGIRYGVITITPNEDYAREVYGTNRYNYVLHDANSLLKTISNIVRSGSNDIKDTILAQQNYIKENEMNKSKNIIEVFAKVLNFNR